MLITSGVECIHTECQNSLLPWNTATNFPNPVLSVVRSIDRQIIRNGQKILEIGAGNLRNALYICRNLKHVDYCVVEMPQVIARYSNKYDEFTQLGGKILSELDYSCTFDTVICTYVLETICPLTKRLSAVNSIVSAISQTGTLIASFRGYPGVKGTKYVLCQAGEGYLTPLHTFIKPHTLSEVKSLLNEAGLNNLLILEQYKADQPQNIHIAGNKLNVN